MSPLNDLLSEHHGPWRNGHAASVNTDLKMLRDAASITLSHLRPGEMRSTVFVQGDLVRPGQFCDLCVGQGLAVQAHVGQSAIEIVAGSGPDL